MIEEILDGRRVVLRRTLERSIELGDCDRQERGMVILGLLGSWCCILRGDGIAMGL